MSNDPDIESGATPDLVFDILSSSRRRMVLYYLRQHNGVGSVKELAQHIAAMENEIPVEEVNRAQEKRVYVSLYQTHLPKLADAMIIDYDKDAGKVSLTTDAYKIDDYLTRRSGYRYPWQLHYLILALIGLGLIVLGIGGAPVFREISPVWLGIGISLAFAISAVVQYLLAQQRQREVPNELLGNDYS